MTDFINKRFPEDISYGATGGPKFSTNVIQIQNGYESRNSNWLYPLCEYDVSHGVKTMTQLKDLITFFRICRGRAIGFRFKDWTDFDILKEESAFNLDLGLDGKPTAQIYKTYTDEFTNTEYRKITKIVENTFKLYKSDVLNTSYSIDIDTGIITFDVISSKTISGATKESNCLITSIAHGYNTGDKIYIRNVLGMTQLNNKVFIITKIDNDSFRLNIDSTLYSTYTGSGLAEKYIDNSIYTFECNFDVPVRFDTDKINISIDDFEVGSWSNVPLVELRGF